VARKVALDAKAELLRIWNLEVRLGNLQRAEGAGGAVAPPVLSSRVIFRARVASII